MTQRKQSAPQPLSPLRQQGYTPKRLASTLPAQGLCWLSSLSLLGGGFVMAQTETAIDNFVPNTETSQPTATTPQKEIVVPDAEKPQPDFSERKVKLQQRLSRKRASQPTETVRFSKPQVEAVESTPSVRISKPKLENSETTPSVRISKPKLENSQPAAKLETETPPTAARTAREPKPETSTRPVPEKLPEVAQPATRSNANDANNAYIDTNDYNSATGNYQPPSSVVVTERSSGCRSVLAVGQGATGACTKVPQATQRVADKPTKSAPSWLKKSENVSIANAQPRRQLLATKINNPAWRGESDSAVSRNNLSGNDERSPRTIPTGAVKTAVRQNRFIPSPSEFVTTTVSSNPIAPSAGTLTPPMIEGNLAPRPSTVSYDFSLASVLPQVPSMPTVAYRGNNSGLIFPLAVPAPITSLFGWRVHPISGDRRFHAGTDLGAPTGTPIVAAARGQVETADWMGGYGLAVTITHNSAQQTLYGHMSEIYVRPGQFVEQGTVIGRVGSTGNSTGPHLHFEVRHMTQDGWVAVDPGADLQAGLSQLVQGLRTAQVP
ncbi:MAG TPA: M23 family metallopeptidase [Nostocaceae cyanobacterium]|nr:M23 family metallopeptidase [Nostocaceae cyanobacterium]